MADEVRPEDAAGALAEIARRRAQVVTLSIIPTWFWWATALLMVGFSVAVEAGAQRPLVVGVATAAFVVGILIVTGRLMLGGRGVEPK